MGGDNLQMLQNCHMILVEIFAGVALILFGVRFLRKGLDRLLGGNLVPWIAARTQNRSKGFLVGICAGVVAPSSTAMSLIAVQLLQLGKFGADRLLALLLGAGVGITIMVQLIAFRITDQAGWFLAVGIIMFQFLKRSLLRGIGQCLLSLGFIFLAMRVIGSAAREISSSSDMMQVFAILEGHPGVLFLGTAILAFAMQSSTASISFGLALALGGVISPVMMVPWVLGTNVGLAITAMVAGWRDPDSRLLGSANLLLKLSFALPLVLVPGLGLALFEFMPGGFARETAMFHTTFNLLVGLAALPLLDQIIKVVRWIIGAENSSAARTAPDSHLDWSALETPSLAIAQATRETLRMADHLRWMLTSLWNGFEHRDRNLLLQVRELDNTVDTINVSITNYLSNLHEGMSDMDARWQIVLLSFANELESVGDIIDKQLVDLILKRIERSENLPQEELEPIKELHRRVMVRFDQAIALLTTRDSSGVAQFLEGKESLNQWCRTIQTTHYEHLRQANGVTAFDSLFFLEMLNGLRRINSHISTIGYALQSRGGKHNRTLK